MKNIERNDKKTKKAERLDQTISKRDKKLRKKMQERVKKIIKTSVPWHIKEKSGCEETYGSVDISKWGIHRPRSRKKPIKVSNRTGDRKTE
jgi:hypothetical protein